jgi:hypothetical protein
METNMKQYLRFLGGVAGNGESRAGQVLSSPAFRVFIDASPGTCPELRLA